MALALYEQFKANTCEEFAVSTSVKMVALLTAKAGKEADLHALLKGMPGPSRSEPGNLRYDLWSDSAQAGRYVLEEIYKDADAIAAHRESKHFQAYLSQVNDFAERLVIVLAPEDVKA